MRQKAFLLVQIEVRHLAPTHDPIDLIRSLGRVPAQPRADLVDAVSELGNHWDPDVRSEAIRVLLVKWKIADARWMAVETIASPSEESSVREEAIYGLAAISTRATQTADARICLGLLCSDKETYAVKGAAYDALLIIFRNPAFPTKRRDFDPDKDVDWVWVEAVREQMSGS